MKEFPILPDINPNPKEEPMSEEKRIEMLIKNAAGWERLAREYGDKMEELEEKLNATEIQLEMQTKKFPHVKWKWELFYLM